MAVTIPQLLARNRNYRLLWAGQIVSDIGDHFNNIAVFALAIRQEHGGLLVGGILIARAIPMLVAGPLAGVTLDRYDRRKVMIMSDLVRAVVSLGFIFALAQGSNTPLFILSAILMFASPFFTSGRNSILPVVAGGQELQAANALTQTTAWATTGVGAFLGGTSVAALGYEWAFILNAISFLGSAACLMAFRTRPGEFLPPLAHTKRDFHPHREFLEGLRYMRSEPLLLAIALIGVGWATGGGAAQILFSVFGERVFHRGAAGIGIIWGAAGCGLVVGGILANWLNKRLQFEGYKRTVSIAYIFHGALYVAFALESNFALALLFIGMSRAAGAMSSVVNYAKILQYASDQYRGRVFATMETMTWSTMMVSLFVAGIATESVNPRTIAAVAGVLSGTTGIVWAWANWRGKLRLPENRN
ncbi:MFS transporter [Bryobacter aggregatus]|uniref:MFS transporter n=1 Tax=Bryobacter aggregatus TaxID=360054 RepID=UPI0004E18F0C|nr:MFS transporter [Bryobacter aggregatus]